MVDLVAHISDMIIGVQKILQRLAIVTGCVPGKHVRIGILQRLRPDDRIGLLPVHVLIALAPDACPVIGLDEVMINVIHFVILISLELESFHRQQIHDRIYL